MRRCNTSATTRIHSTCIDTCCLLGQRFDRLLDISANKECATSAAARTVAIDWRNFDLHENDSVPESRIKYRVLYIPTSAPITIKSVENCKEPSSCPTTRFGGAGCCNTTRSPYIRDTNLFDECYMSSTNLTVPAFSNAVTTWIYSQRTQNSYSSAVRTYRLYREQRRDPNYSIDSDSINLSSFGDYKTAPLIISDVAFAPTLVLGCLRGWMNCGSNPLRVRYRERCHD